jgi:preprotein translocase subunit SecE
MNKFVKFFKESRQELTKVVWPTKDQVVISTRVVLVSVVIIAAVLGLVDYLLLQGLYLLF